MTILCFLLCNLIEFLNEITNVPQRSKLHRGSSDYHQFMFSMLRKDQSDGSLQSFVEDSSCINAPSNAAPDPLWSSFVINFPVADPLDDRIESSDKISMVNNVSDERMVERYKNSALFQFPAFGIPKLFIRPLVSNRIKPL